MPVRVGLREMDQHSRPGPQTVTGAPRVNLGTLGRPQGRGSRLAELFRVEGACRASGEPVGCQTTDHHLADEGPQGAP